MRAPQDRLWVRLVGVFLLATLPPVLGAGWITSRWLETEQHAAAGERLAAMASLGRDLVQGFLDRGSAKLLTVGRLLGGRIGGKGAESSKVRDAVLADLDRLVEPADVYLELQYYGVEETRPSFVAQRSTQELRKAQSVAGSEARQQRIVQENVDSQLVRQPIETGEPEVARTTREHFGFRTVPVSVPVGAGKRRVGAVVGYLDTRQLSALLSPLARGGHLVRVVDAGGSVVAEAGAAPGDVLDARARVPAVDWEIIVAAPRSAVFASVQAVQGQATTWTVLAVVLAVVMSLLSAAWIVRPIAALTRTAQAMQQGDLGARAELERRDEIGRLGQAFDQMAAALQQLDAAKTEFIGTVSHELRTPLTSVRLSLDNIGRGLLGELNERQQRALDRVGTDVARLDRIVRDTLELARLEAGVDTVRGARCDLAGLARDAVDLVGHAAGGAEFDVQGGGSAWADPDHLRRVLVNLLDNAVKFAPAGTPVSIELADGYIRVRDRGPGFSIDRPFERFAQGATDGVANPGVGLGLSIVARLVALHGGTVEAQNDDGAVVTVRLPTGAGGP